MAKPDRDHFLKQYGDGAGMVKLASGGPSAPRPYFWNATPNKAHADTAKDISEKTQKYVHKAVNDFKKVVDMWKLQAKFESVKVMSVSCIGTPGCLKGPELKSLPPFSLWEKSEKEYNAQCYAKAAVEGLSAQWKKWQDKVMIPGLPMWPAFAAYPGPMAPPMPNVPFPLVAMPSAAMAEMTQPKLKDAMAKALKDADTKDKIIKNDPDKQHIAIFDTIAMPIALNFLLWILQQQVMLLMGKGPVPSFAPPYVPVGPVVGGSEIPGMHLIT
jgi:hypothetical protein